MDNTFRAAEISIRCYSNKPVLDCEFEFIEKDDEGNETDYDFSAQDGLFLTIKDRKDGLTIKEWTHLDGLTLVNNIILWNEYDAAKMAFSKGMYFVEVGYELDDYTPDDIRIVLAYGDCEFI